MKKVMTILTAGILVLFFINPISASGYGGGNDSSGGKVAMAEAIEHADMGHTQIASELVTDALQEMYQFMEK